MDKEALAARIQAMLGAPVRIRHSEYWYNCPFHDDKRASMHVDYEKGIWYCFACQPQGREATLTGLAEKLGIIVTREGYGDEFLGAVDFNELIGLYHGDLMRNAQLLVYLREQRALSIEIIRRAKLGLSKWGLVIPIADKEGKWCAAKVRRLEEAGEYGWVFSKEEPRYWWLTKRHHPLIPENDAPSVYPHHLLRDAQTDVVYLVGGELDALVLWSRGYPAVTSTKGETYVSEELLEVVKDRTVFIALDNEPTTQARIDEIVEQLKEAAFAVLVVPPVEGCKDATDVAVAGKLDEYLRKTRLMTTEPSRLWVEGCRYYIQTKNDVVPVTSFIFRPHAFLENVHYGGSYLHTDVLCAHGETIKDLMIPLSFFDDTSVRMKWLTQHSAPHLTVYRHSQDAWLAIKDRLAARVPVQKVSSIFGLQRVDDRWVFVTDTICVPELSIRSFDPENVGVVPFRTIYTVPVEPNTLKPVCEVLLRLHARSVIVPLLAHFHAALLSPWIRMQMNNQYPIVMIWGDAGVGKTTLVYNVFCPLIGLAPITMLAAGQTESTLRKYADMLALPLVIDEFTPGRYSEEVLASVKALIHACYDMISKQVSQSATALERPYLARAPLVLVGERGYVITREQALVERVRLVRIHLQPSPDNAVAYKEWRALLRNKTVAFYATTLVHWLMSRQEEWERWWASVEEKVNELQELLPERLGFRQLYMWQVALMGWEITRNFWGEIGCVDLLTEKDEEYLSPVMLISVPQNPLIALLSAADHLAAVGKIAHNRHYKVRVAEKELVIALHDVVHEITKEMRGTEYANLSVSYVRQFLENEKRQGAQYVKECWTQARFSGGEYGESKRKWCCVLDYEKLLESYPELHLTSLLPYLYGEKEVSEDEEEGDTFAF
ncbi:MAG: CHC2 zinc finger domain-containing protein [Thermofilaceae archaeon]